jgi:DNA repair protein RecO (recombination protein O)
VRWSTAEALLLDVRDLHDRDRVVTFLTRDHGKKRGVARGARTPHSRFSGQLQPLAKAQVTWYEKEGRDLARISAIEMVRPAHRLQADLEGILLGSYLADHVLEFAQEDEASDHLFRLLDSTLAALLEGVDRDLAARYFEAWVLRLAGIFPSPHDCPVCGRPFGEGAVLPPSGEALLCRDCAPSGGSGASGGSAAVGGFAVSPAALELLRQIGRLGLPRVAPPPVAVLRQVEELCARVRRHFLQRELRSYEVIQSTRAAL